MTSGLAGRSRRRSGLSRPELRRQPGRGHDELLARRAGLGGRSDQPRQADRHGTLCAARQEAELGPLRADDARLRALPAHPPRADRGRHVRLRARRRVAPGRGLPRGLSRAALAGRARTADRGRRACALVDLRGRPHQSHAQVRARRDDRLEGRRRQLPTAFRGRRHHARERRGGHRRADATSVLGGTASPPSASASWASRSTRARRPRTGAAVRSRRASGRTPRSTSRC